MPKLSGSPITFGAFVGPAVWQRTSPKSPGICPCLWSFTPWTGPKRSRIGPPQSPSPAVEADWYQGRRSLSQVYPKIHVSNHRIWWVFPCGGPVWHQPSSRWTPQVLQKKVIQGTVGKWIGKNFKINLKHDDKTFNGKTYIIPHAYIPLLKKEVAILM